MAEFQVDLSAPRGQGAQPVQAVQEQIVPEQPNPLLTGIVNIFAKGLEADRKQSAADRKAAIVGEYIKNEQVYASALTTGQWNASQVGMASRSNFTRMIASYPEYVTELQEAKKSVYDGTDVGEAQKKVDQEVAFKNSLKTQASSMGFTFYDGMSQAAQDATILAAQTEIRTNKATDEAYKRNAEARAVASDKRAGESHAFSIQEHVDRENAVKGVLEVADKNFDALNTTAKDLISNPNIPFEQKQLIMSQNVGRIKSGLQAVSARNPELAAPWSKLVDDINNTFQALADPKIKSERELTDLKNQFDAQQYKAKLLITADPKARNAVALSNLFGNNDSLLKLGVSPVLIGTLAQLGLGPNSGQTPAQVVGTPDEKGALKAVKGALNSLQTGSAVGDKEAMTIEAVNTVNGVLKQNATMQGPITAPMLKELSAFYSSPEFGKLAEKGQLDKPTVQAVKQVFQVSYEPAVIEAVQNRLNTAIEHSPGRDQGNRGKPKQTLLDTVDVKFNGSGVSFVTKAGAFDTLSSSFTRDALKEAEGGLNTLIRMGAHMEGTTDYASYWEKNKQHYLPNVYPDPNKLKVGQVVKGKNGKSYKYIGGNYNDIANSYMELPDAGSE
jgi:hypothetical protein